MIIVSIDPGTHTGWCIHDTAENWWHSGTWDLSGSRFDSHGMRFVRFRRLLRELLANANNPRLVAYEEVRRHLGVDAAHAYGGYLAVLQEECAPCRFCDGTGRMRTVDIIDGSGYEGDMHGCGFPEWSTCPHCQGINSKGIEYMGIPVGTVKKTATGKGNASKADMMQAARERWPGWEPVDDNEADARWIAVAAAREVENG